MSRSRNYVFTWPNYPADFVDTLDSLLSKYIIAGRELAPTTLLPHLQGFIVFTHAKSVRAARALLPGCHVEVARGSPAQCIAYSSKEDTDPYTRGTPPLSQEEKGQKEKERYEEAWRLAKLGEIEAIAPDIRLRLYSTIKRIATDYMPRAVPLATTCGIWIFGESGTGKTRSVLDAYPDAYPKPRSMWWDGYQHQPIVLLDDVDKFDVKLGGALKHWADHYPFIAEIKGGSLQIRPSKFVVTSQYRIEDIWQDQATVDALLRRFVVIEKKLGLAIEI